MVVRKHKEGVSATGMLPRCAPSAIGCSVRDGRSRQLQRAGSVCLGRSASLTPAACEGSALPHAGKAATVTGHRATAGKAANVAAFPAAHPAASRLSRDRGTVSPATFEARALSCARGSSERRAPCRVRAAIEQSTVCHGRAAHVAGPQGTRLAHACEVRFPAARGWPEWRLYSAHPL